MRKIYFLLMAVLCCFSANVHAADETVYYVNSTSWSKVMVHAWDGTAPGTTWPGLEATKEAYQLQSYDVYSFTAPAGAYGKCIFNSGSGAQTADLTWSAGKYFFNGKWYDRAELEGETIVPTNDTVYFVNKDNWSKVNLYAWGGAGASITWPGIAMTKADYQLKDADVYYFVAKPGDYSKCIFNDGSSQTADLDWTAGKYFYDGKWYALNELEGGEVEPEVPATYYITGNADLVGGNGWGANEIQMIAGEEVHTYTFESLATGITYQMKITDGTWDKNWGYSAVQNAPAGVSGDNDGNIVFALAETGNVDVTFNGTNITLAGNFAHSETPEPETGVTYNVTVPAGTYACYIAGEMNGWSQQEMTKVDDTHYTITIAEATTAMKYKYCSGPDWKYVEKTAEGGDVNNRTYTENDVVAAWAEVYNPNSGGTPTDIDQIVVDEKISKFIYDGQLIIVRDGVHYNVMGQVVK